MSTTTEDKNDLNNNEQPLEFNLNEKDEPLNDSTDSIVQPAEINPNSQLKMDILKAFGADLNNKSTRDNILFVNKALIYPCGKHLALRDLSNIDDNSDSHKNEQLFIFLEPDVKEVNCLNVSRDSFLFLVTTENTTHAEISVYNLSKISFNSFTIFKPRRKVMSTEYTRYIYAAFTQEGNVVCALGQNQLGQLNLF